MLKAVGVEIVVNDVKSDERLVCRVLFVLSNPGLGQGRAQGPIKESDREAKSMMSILCAWSDVAMILMWVDSIAHGRPKP